MRIWARAFASRPSQYAAPLRIDGNCVGIWLIESQNTRIEKNRVYRSDGSCNLTPAGNGITSDDVKNVVQHNVANQNVGDGIHVDSPITRIGKNTTNSNGDLGIEAVPGVVDGGGNRAFGNGNPLQCLNIFCKTNGRGK